MGGSLGSACGFSWMGVPGGPRGADLWISRESSSEKIGGPRRKPVAGRLVRGQKPRHLWHRVDDGSQRNLFSAFSMNNALVVYNKMEKGYEAPIVWFRAAILGLADRMAWPSMPRTSYSSSPIMVLS